MEDSSPVPPNELARRHAHAVAVTECVLLPTGDVLLTGRGLLSLTDTSMTISAETVLALAGNIANESLSKIRQLQARQLNLPGVFGPDNPR
jgi:hypothetical protein